MWQIGLIGFLNVSLSLSPWDKPYCSWCNYIDTCMYVCMYVYRHVDYVDRHTLYD